MESKVGNTVGFSVISKIILNNAVRNYQQLDYMELLSDNIRVEPNFQWDESNFSRMIHGKRPVFPKFIEYYQSKKGLEALTEAVEVLLDSIVDVPRLLKELETAVRCDGTISIQKREELLSGTDAEVIAKVLQFAIIRPEQNVKCQSPRIERQFIGASLPKRDKHFIGRQDELVSIDEHLKEDNVLFISGVPGIGKRALAIQYGHVNRKRYTNQIFLRYRLSMKRTLTDLQCIEENTQENAEERFQRHLRLLNCLEEDSLLVILGMDCLPEKDESFELLYQLNCHLIITTELEMKEENRLVLEPFDDMGERLQLFEAYCPKRKLRNASEEDIHTLLKLTGGHTYAVQLTALTVRNGFLTVPELKDMIVAKGLPALDEYPVEVKRDGKYQYDSVKKLLGSVIEIQKLGEREQYVLGNFTLMPMTGINKARFGKWTGQIRALQNLIRLGWIQEDENGTLKMNTLVCEVVSETLRPDLTICTPLLDQLDKESENCEAGKEEELMLYMQSAVSQIWNKDADFLHYLKSFMRFTGQYCCNLIQGVMNHNPLRVKYTTAGREATVFLKVIYLFGKKLLHTSKTEDELCNSAYHKQLQLMFKEIKALASEADRNKADVDQNTSETDRKKTLLFVACTLLAFLVLIEKRIDLLIPLVHLKKKISRKYENPSVQNYDIDYFLLAGISIGVFEKKQYKRDFLSLVDEKIQESIQNGGSQKQIKRLEDLKNAAERGAGVENEFDYMKSLFESVAAIPWIAQVFRRVKKL